MTDKPITEKQIKKIVQMEIRSCFEQLTSDVKEIKQALLGNEYQKGGLVAVVQSHEDYIKRNRITNIADRGMRVIEWYESLAERKGTDGKSDLERLQDGIHSLQAISTFKKWLTFLGITNIGTIIALIFEMFNK